MSGEMLIQVCSLLERPTATLRDSYESKIITILDPLELIASPARVYPSGVRRLFPGNLASLVHSKSHSKVFVYVPAQLSPVSPDMFAKTNANIVVIVVKISIVVIVGIIVCN